MPYPVNAARRYPFPKARYRVKNWGEYDQALQQRGSLTVWVTPEAIAAWQAPPTGQRGRSPFYWPWCINPIKDKLGSLPGFFIELSVRGASQVGSSG
jgi:hypothetical protein